jgi:predicted ferric reductase
MKSPYLLRGVLWTALYLLLVLLPPGVLLFGKLPPGTSFGWDFAVALGFSGLSILFTMFVLTARFRWTTHAFGIDIIYYFHRWIAVTALLLLLAHPVILVGMEPLLLEYLRPDAPVYMLAGAGSLLAILLLVTSSLWRKQLRLHYDLWRMLHIVLAVLAVTLAAVHVHGVDYYTGMPGKRELWLLLAVAVTGLVLYVRVIRPWLVMRRRYHVVDVVPVTPDTWTLTIAPDGHAGMAFQPGQFAWLSLGHVPFAMREHPFSIASSAQQPQRIQFLIKQLGDFTAHIGNARPGQRIWIDGPFGAFSVDRYPAAPGYVFIAGGVGIAPILGMLRTLADRGERRPLWLFYCCRNLQQLAGGEVLQELQSRLTLQTTLVPTEPAPGWSGACGLLGRELLARSLPEGRANLEYFLCGPTPMSASVEHSLRGLGVPLRRIHNELFDMV